MEKIHWGEAWACIVYGGNQVIIIVQIIVPFCRITQARLEIQVDIDLFSNAKSGCDCYSKVLLVLTDSTYMDPLA